MVATTNNSKAHLYSDGPLIWHGFVLMLWLPLTLLAFYLAEAAFLNTPGQLPPAQLSWLAPWRWPLALSLLLIAATLPYHYHRRVGRRLIRPFNQLQEKLLSSREIAQTFNINKSDAVSNLHTLIDTLEQQVTLMRRQHQSMQDAITSAEQANSAKSEFLANMSHEIRTPLTAILGHLHLLSASKLETSQQVNVDRITTAARILLDVINDILDFSRIESGKLELESVSFELQTVLSNMHAMLNLQAKNKGLSFNIEAPSDSHSLIGDPLRLSQVLLNLTNNAIKFTDSGYVQLAVTVTALEHQHSQLSFRISDTGIGMSQAEIERLFQTFSQADSSTTRRYGGSGLGLAICQQLVEQMGGHISVQSVPAEGSTFSFAISLKNGQKDQDLQLEELEPASPSTLAGMRILLVEDNALLTEYQSALLQGHGALVSCAEDGLAAIAQLQSDPSFDIVLMDIQMPRMDGLTASREIRKQYSPQQLPIIAMTAHALQAEVEKSLEAGMNAHLCKPVESKLLFSTLLRFARERHATPTGTVSSPPPANTVLPDNMQHFDLASALSSMGGKPSLLRRLLKKMQQEYRGSADELARLLQDDEHATALRLAHSLKGVAATLGATQLQSAAHQLESALRDEPDADHHLLAAALGTQLAACIAELDQLFASDDASQADNKAGKTLIEQADWDTLITLLKERNIRASRHFAELKPRLAQISALDVAEIDIAMQCLDYAHALNLLRPLGKRLNF